jgi:hypothetical protein
MKHVIVALFLVGGFITVSTMEASAIVCARGVVRAGCVAGGGATVGAGAVGVRRGAVGVRGGAVGVRGGAVGVHRGAVGVRRGVRR